MSAPKQFDLTATEEKVAELVDRIVAASDPFEIIAFGSRARGDHHPDSDLDVAVIVEDEHAGRQSLHKALAGLRLALDVLPMSKERFDRFRPWINTVQQQIDREGVRLYERGGKPADRAAFRRLCS